MNQGCANGQKIAWISTAVTPYSETVVDYANAATNDCLRHWVAGLHRCGVESTLLLPRQSDSEWPHQVFDGDLQTTAAVTQHHDGTATGQALQGMVDYAWEHQDAFDLVVNLGHDFLPLYMVGKFRTPYISLPNLCNTTPRLDSLIRHKARTHPQHVLFFSHAQRSILGTPLNPVLYQPFHPADFQAAGGATVTAPLGWAGRIVPEKGLARALQIAALLGSRLWVAGPVHDGAYFQHLQNAYPDTLQYLGCLSRPALYQQLAHTGVFLQTQDAGWQEAFGRSTAEAYLAGCPVLYHPSGANPELAQLTGGGIEIRQGNEAAAYAQALALDRQHIQRRAQAAFDREHIARQFIALTAFAD